MFYIINKYKFSLVLSAICFICFGTIFSQEKRSNQQFIHYSTRDGLSGRYQTCFAQDAEGFIWIGTTEGLNRFDGYNFKVYRQIPGDSTSLCSSYITTLFIDSFGTLWIGTNIGGLCRYNKDQDNFTTIRDGQGNDFPFVSCIVEDPRHKLWIVTFEAIGVFDPLNGLFTGMFYYENGSNKQTSLASNEIKTLAFEGNTLWIGYGSGLFSALNIETLQFNHFQLPGTNSKSSTDNFINSICPDGDKLWITTWGKGVWVFDKRTQKSYLFDGVKSSFVNCVYKDKKNNIWIGTESDGLIFIDKDRNKTTYYTHDDYNYNSLSNNCIAWIFIDRQDNLWLANKKGDMHYFIVNNPFRGWIRNPTNPNELSKSDITSVLETDNQYLWVGFMEGGIDIIDLKNQKKQSLGGGNDQSNLGKVIVTTIYQDKDNDIWLGTYLGGLKKYNKATGKFTTYLHDTNNIKSLSGNDIRKITEDSKGNLWIAVQGGGLNKFDKKTGQTEHFLVNYANMPSSPVLSNWLTTIACDNHDNIWIGTVSGASLLSSDLKSSKHFMNNPKDSNSLSNDYVNVIFEDSDRTIWIGTNNGLNRLNKVTNNFTRYSVINGLPNDQILGIIEDNKKNLWIGTSRGLSKCSLANLTFKNYTTDDGLVTDEFNNGSCFMNSRGEIYFGGTNGLVVFSPDSLKNNNLVPPVYITDFKLFNKSVVFKNGENSSLTLDKPITQCKEITLKYFQNIIGFEFVALNYVNQRKNLYSYKMEGFDQYWSTPATKREATYTNLHFGTYIFKVKACNNDGIWNETGASIRIIIKPPFWKTAWAIILYIVFIVLLLYLFRLFILFNANIKRKLEVEKLEVEKLHELDAQKIRFFANVSHEFRTPLTLIIGPLEKLIQTSKDDLQQTNLRLIQRNAQRLLRLINQLMDFRKIDNTGLEINYVQGDIIKFIVDLSNVFSHEASQRNIHFSVNAMADQLIIYFDRDKLDKILYNLLSNAFKFTPDYGNISLTINTSDNNEKLNLIVEDTGKGIPEYAQSKIFERFYQVENNGGYGTGIGLSLTKDIVNLLNGCISVESEEGKGSKFTVTLPIIYQIDPENNKKLISTNTEETQEQSLGNYFDFKDNPQPLSGVMSGNKNMPLLLIVEDNPDMRLFISNEFIGSYNIIEAANGKAGLEKAIAEIPDIIISDVMMPVMDGIEFSTLIKSNEKTCHIPIILLTALSSDENTVIGLKSGADDYIIKPFNNTILKLKVRNIVESRKLFQSKFIKEPDATIKEIAINPLDEKFLQKAYQIVEQNIDNPYLDVNDFTAFVGMSRAQLYRKIDALTGQTVKEFIRIIRLKKAAEMLLKEHKNIKEVAYAVGFNSITYFTKSFTDYFGVSPSKYVNLNR